MPEDTIQDNKRAESADPNPLWAALDFRMTKAEAPQSKRMYDTWLHDEYMTVLIFQCRSTEERSLFRQSSWSVCGEHLCYWT